MKVVQFASLQLSRSTLCKLSRCATSSTMWRHGWSKQLLLILNSACCWV